MRFNVFIQEVSALRTELQMLQSIQHAHIVQYYGSLEDDNVLSIFMEYLPGVSIQFYVRVSG